MPVSVVCESTANAVNAALRESLSGGNCGADDSKKIEAANESEDSLQSKLVASAKRVLLTKIEYEEVDNFSQSVLDSLKSKYIVIKPKESNGPGSSSVGMMRKESTATCSSSGGGSNYSSHNNNNGSAMNGYIADNTNGNSNGSNNSNNNNNNNSNISNCNAKQKSNPNELPQPKRVLFPRENVRIGWKNPSRKWQVGVGMMNVGNTCYLNSTLQALLHVPSMANWLMSDTQHMERCDAADAGCIICAVAKTLQASQNSQSAIRPYFVYSKLKSICKHLVMGRQEDAHEFLRYLVEAMEKSYLSRFRNYKELDQYSKETTPLNQILGGYLKSAVRCLACGHVSVTFQHFQDLLLDIRKADTVEEALEGYFSRERLEDMGYKCEACKKKVSATKQFSLERAPIALCIQLKRFSMLGTKINKQITIKPRLDLSKFASRKNPGEQLTYRLVAMVTHLGASQHCGHYTAIGLTESGTYYNYDDSYVRPISVQSVCNTNAYIIFYEMDTSPARQVTSTQVSGAGAEIKENYQKLNGYSNVSSHTVCGPSPQRIIGPQLNTGGLTTFNNNSNKIIPNSALAHNPTNGNKLGINRQSCMTATTSQIPTSSSKIMIHFKNNNNAAAATTAIKTNATSSTTTATATSSSGSNNTLANNTTQIQNGLLSGTGKFQGTANSKPPLAGTSNKGQVPANSNGSKVDNTGICNDYGNNEVSSSTPTKRNYNQCTSSSPSTTTKTTLPSMPKLFETPPTNIAQNHHQSPTVKKSLMQQSPLKSLVPYESGSDDDDDASTNMAITTTTLNSNLKNQLKRSSTSSSDGSDSSDEGEDAKPTNGVKVKKAVTTTPTTTTNGTSSSSVTNSTHFLQSKSKQKSNSIDEIFNCHKRNSGYNHNGVSTSPTKKCKSSSQGFIVSSTTPAVNPSCNQGDNGGGYEEYENDCNGNGDLNTRKPFKRSHSTPPSPPVIKTKTGLWQVTTLQPVTASISPPEQKPTVTTTVAYKNPKNPFATEPKPDIFTKRPKSSEKFEKRTTFAGNGYNKDSVSDSAVNELLKQSHRGYGGAQVLTWNGTETDLEKEVKEEARQQRRRDWEEEAENDMDRGRQKKVKSHKELQQPSHNPGYNPFQEQDNQRRWKNGGGYHRFHHGNQGYFRRNNFQRNKNGAFKRFNYKFQRSQQRNNNDHYRRTS